VKSLSCFFVEDVLIKDRHQLGLQVARHYQQQALQPVLLALVLGLQEQPVFLLALVLGLQEPELEYQLQVQLDQLV